MASLIALLGAELAAIAALVLLGRVAPFDLALDADTWSRAAPGDALAAALRFVALGAASWLWVVTVLQAAATLHGAVRRRPPARCRSPHLRSSHFRSPHVRPPHLRPPGLRIAPPAIRALVERAVVGTVVVGAVGFSAAPFAHGATPDPAVVTVVRDGRGGRVESLPNDPLVPSRPVTAPPAAVLPETAASAMPVLDAAAPRVVVVGPGDNLWELAARELARARGIPRAALTDGEIAPYWVRTCDANRDRVASGDLDLIHAGEALTMPPTT